MNGGHFSNTIKCLFLAASIATAPFAAPFAQEAVSSETSIMETVIIPPAHIDASAKDSDSKDAKIVKFPVKMKVTTIEPTPPASSPQAKKEKPAAPVAPTTVATPPIPPAAAPGAVEAPIPSRRPDIQTASPEFVEKARRTMVDTYTIVKRDDDPRPEPVRREIVKGVIPPTRLSIADLANDPLASQIVDLSPEELAMAMNGIKPSSGVRPDVKPRIVRQEGERIYRSRSPQDKRVIPSPVTVPVSLAPRPPVAETQPDDNIGNGIDSSTAPAETDGRFTLVFKAGETNLSVSNEARLERALSETLRDQGRRRLQIMAWASPTDGKEASARRTALSRALSIRAYLIGRGIDPSRMDVRAMGIQTDPKAAADQVDMVLTPEKS